jgi:hypothetical protein
MPIRSMRDAGLIPAADGRPARVLLFSERNTFVHIFEAAQMEFEDVIASMDDVAILAPSFAPRRVARRAVGTLRQRLGAPKAWAVDDIAIDREYDLFFASFHFPPNIAHLNELKGLRSRCRKMACFIVEMWSPDIAGAERYLRLLEVFDHVFLFNGSTVQRVERIVGRPCSFLPAATDTLRFCPYPTRPARDVDVYALGRSSPVAHRQLLELAERGERHYLFANVNHHLPDYRAHRVLISGIMKRTRYFPAYRLNDTPGSLTRTGGDETLVTRYFEGAAGGAVMIGSTPATREFDDNFDWPDAVVPAPYDPADVRALLAELDAQPERMAAARRNNVVNSLRRHDWMHRWASILDAVGLPHSPGMQLRRERLERLAQMADEAPDAVPGPPASFDSVAGWRSGTQGVAR